MNKINEQIIYYILFDDDNLLLKGIKYLKKQKINIYEVYTPFPIHGMNHLLNIKPTNISIISFFSGLFGFIISTIITCYTMNYDWPQNIGGKPEFFWYMNFPSFIPVIFEITIFCAAHFMCIYYLFSCKLYPGAKSNSPDIRTTDDKFLVEIRVKKNSENLNLINLFIQSGAIEISKLS